MTDIVANFTSGGAPANALAVVPTIDIMRLDTDAIVVAAGAMSDTGALGKYKFQFTGLRGVRYSALIDGDPTATGQVDVRYFSASFDREVFDLWRTRGLDPSIAKTTTELVEEADYDEDIGDIHIDQVKVGAVITTSST